MKYTIDAAGKRLGRVASLAALYLRGKGSADFTPNKLPETLVEIVNASKLHITERKANETFFLRYTGYPGGLKSRTVAELITKRGHGELMRRTILGMLPRNRQRSRIIKHLTIRN